MFLNSLYPLFSGSSEAGIESSALETLLKGLGQGNKFFQKASPHSELRLQLAGRIHTEISLSTAEIAGHCLSCLLERLGQCWCDLVVALDGDRMVRWVAKVCSVFKHFQL